MWFCWLLHKQLCSRETDDIFQELQLTHIDSYSISTYRHFFLISVLALLQPALFILSQMDLGPLASVQYFGGFISADFRQTLLSLKLKCLFSFSKFSKCQLLPVTISQNWCICCSSSCCISTRTMRRSKPKAEVEPMLLV